MNKQGGKRERAGRPKGIKKPIKSDTEKVKPRKISLTDAEYQNYLMRGGAKWLRPVLRSTEEA